MVCETSHSSGQIPTTVAIRRCRALSLTHIGAWNFSTWFLYAVYASSLSSDPRRIEVPVIPTAPMSCRRSATPYLEDVATVEVTRGRAGDQVLHDGIASGLLCFRYHLVQPVLAGIPLEHSV